MLDIADIKPSGASIFVIMNENTIRQIIVTIAPKNIEETVVKALEFLILLLDLYK